MVVVGDNDVDVHFIDDGIAPANLRTDDGLLGCLDFKGGGGGGREQLDGTNVVADMVMLVMTMRWCCCLCFITIVQIVNTKYFNICVIWDVVIIVKCNQSLNFVVRG